MQQENESNTQIRVNISKKIDKSLKSELDKLERVSNTASTVRTTRSDFVKSATKRQLVDPIPTKKIDLNKEFNEKSNEPTASNKQPPTKKHVSTSVVNPISTTTTTTAAFNPHKNPVTVDELRSRVYQGTMGVLPLRKSHEIDGLNLMMKGKPLSITTSSTVVPAPLTNRSDILNKDSYVYYEGGASDDEILHPIIGQSEDEDEGIDNEHYERAEHFHANTPATPNNFASFSNKFLNPYKKSQQIDSFNNKEENFQPKTILNDYYYQELLKYRNNQINKPAILPQTGTTGRAQYSERPKPLAKPKTLTEEFKMKKIRDTLHDANLILTDDERHQLLMENEVKSLVDDAKKFAKLSPIKSKQISKRLHKQTDGGIGHQSSSESIMRDKSSGFSVEDISNEKKLLKSVEGLISAIKSGQLVKEQENSSKRIQEILGSVLDKASLSLLDPSFKQETSIIEENEGGVDEETNTDAEYQQHQQSSSLINDTSNLLKVPSTTRYSAKSSRHSAKSSGGAGGDAASSKAETTSQLDQDNTLMEQSSRSMHADGYYLDTERREGGDEEEMNRSTNKIDDLMAEYDREIQAYLASLSPQVTYEDILNTTAQKVRIFEKEKPNKKGLTIMNEYNATKSKKSQESSEVPVSSQANEERFARNLHYFCMLEHERRSVLLLPEELADVTRKFHTRNKYQFMQTQKNRQHHVGRLSVARTSETPHSGGNSIGGPGGSAAPQRQALSSAYSVINTDVTEDTVGEKSHEAAAQRVFDNLNEIIRFERQKTHYYNNKNDKSDDFDTKSIADSGIGADPNASSLESWRMQAETALHLPEDFCLHAKKMNLERVENISEFSLTFLRPAPPKMSMRPTQIRTHLFPTYKSVAPPVDDENLLKKPLPPSPRRIKLSPIKSVTGKSLIHSTPNSAKFNLIDELDDEDSVDNLTKFSKKSVKIEDDNEFEDSEMEFQYIVEKILQRQYKSETDLRKMKWHEDDREEESTTGFGIRKDPLFEKDPSLFRTLSDSILTRRKTSKKINEFANEKDQEEEFLKIDTDYNDAIDEVIYQKEKIRDDYWSKNPLDSASVVSTMQKSVLANENLNESIINAPEEVEEAAEDDEVRSIENKNSRLTLKNSNDTNNSKTTSTNQSQFFPKTIKKTAAEAALEAGRNYMIMPERKKGAKRYQTKNANFKGKRLNLNLLDKIENDIFESNVKELKRSESTDKIKFPIRFTTIENSMLRESNKIRKARRPSATNLGDFESFKVKQNFKKSKWYTNENDFYDNEREWVRDIWVEWFDEVIPQLDGTIGVKQPKNLVDNSNKKILQRKANAAPSNKNSTVNFNNPAGINKTSRSKIGGSVMSKKSLMLIDQKTLMTEDDDDDDKPRIVKSPTPYATYDQVEFINDVNTELDLENIKLFEREIEKITARIENRANGMDLCRRGTLYRKLGLIKLGLDDLNRAIEMEPNMLDAYWQRILIYLVQDKKLDAMDSLKFLTNLGHLSKHLRAGAFLVIGDLYAEQKDIGLAIVNYSQTVKYNPTDYRAFFKRAQMYELRGDIRMAMDDYLTTTKLNPKIYEAWFKHGMYYYNNKNYHYAIVDFTELIKNNPNNQSHARLYRGKCYLNLEDFQAALDDFSIALHLDPNDWESFYHRGCLLRKLYPRQALQDLSVSLLIESGDENINAYLHRGILYSDNERYDEAIKDFQSVLAISQEFAPAYVNLGIIYMNVTMNYWKAIKMFNMAIKSNPVYIRAYLCRAQAYRIIHDLKRAYIDYTKAIHMDPLNTQIYIYRGQVILEMGNLKLAAFCVQHASFLNEGGNKLRPKDDSNSLVRMLSSRGQKDMTKSISRFSGFSNQTSQSNLSSTSNQSVTQRALVFSFLKNYNKAIAILDYDLKIKLSSDIFNLLGRVYMKAKNWEQAVITFEKSIEYNTGGMKVGNRSVNNISMLTASMSKLSDKDSKAKKKDLIDAYFMRGQCLLELYRSQEAYESFHQVIELDPANAEAFYYRGLSRVSTNHSKCIQDFNRALAINPELFEAFLARACIYGMQGRFTKAILNCNQAIKLNKKAVRGYLYRGALKYLARSPLYAIDDLTDAIKLDQTCALAYYNRALCYQQIKQYKNALRDFSVVIMLGDYLKFKVLINRGLLYFTLKDYGNSLIDFKFAAEFLPEDFKIQHMIGVCLHKLKRYSEAIKKLTETHELNENFLDSLISRGNVYVDYGNQEGFDRAQNDYEHVLLKNPRNLDAHVNLAYLYQITGRFKRAWQQFTNAIQIKSNFADAYEGRSVVCLQMSDTFAALKDMNQAIRLKPSAELFVNRGVIYQFMADNVNAMRDYQTAIMTNATYALAYYNSANIYLLHRQFAQAINNLDIVIDKCEMKDESTYQNRAIAKAFNGDTGGAFRDLCEAIKYGSYSAHIFMNRGLLLLKMENYKLAEKDLNTAINLSPNDALLYKLRADCRGKLERKEEAIEDYKLSIDIKFREDMRKKYLKR